MSLGPRLYAEFVCHACGKALSESVGQLVSGAGTSKARTGHLFLSLWLLAAKNIDDFREVGSARTDLAGLSFLVLRLYAERTVVERVSPGWVFIS